MTSTRPQQSTAATGHTSIRDAHTQSAPTPGVLLIDDDPTFCALVEAFGRKINVPVRHMSSVLELKSMQELSDIGVAIIDYHLEGSSGVETADLISQFHPDLPVIVISGDNLHRRDAHEGWPQSVKQFVPKSAGVGQILGVARTLMSKSAR